MCKLRHNQILIIMLMTLLFHSEIIVSVTDATVYRFLHLLQNNLVGIPLVHEKTEWNFDPEISKQRRIQYEKENGRFGKYAIAKLGMGIGYKGPWGDPVKS